MEIWQKIQKACSLQGKFVATLATLQIFGMWWHSLISGKPIPEGTGFLYVTIIGAYTASRVSLKNKDKKIQIEKEKNGHEKCAKGGKRPVPKEGTSGV